LPPDQTHDDDRWRIVHLHFSLAVPDEELPRLAAGT
jgi:hypothetical protein